MKKLLLASVASNVIHKAKSIFPKPFNEIRLGVVPTAANIDTTEKPWLTAELKTLTDLGFSLKTINLENRTKTELQGECDDVDALYVTGGNTFYLLYHVQKSDFDKIAKNFVSQGKIYISVPARAQF